MNHLLSLICGAAVAGTLLGACATADARPPIVEGSHEVAGEGYGFAAMRHTYAVGQGAEMHSHDAPRLVVVLQGGTLEAVTPDGETSTLELTAGAVIFRPAESHELRNLGDSTIEIIEMDLE